MANKLTEIYELMRKFFGPQYWWPGDTKFEIIVGAILAQNTNWSNVEKAINNLKSDNSLDAEKLYRMDIIRLAELIRPAGYYKVKAKRLKNFLDWLFENYGGDLQRLENLATQQFREGLLSVNGIGLETADSILLYGFERAVFVVDTYTARVAVRHKLIEPGAEYEQLQYLFESGLDSDVKLFNEYHALIVRLGKEFCRPQAKCDKCPLNKLPHEVETEYF